MNSLENAIMARDVLDGLKEVPDNSVTLVVTSPPYNCNINYGNHDDNMKWADYIDWLRSIMRECKRILRPGGRIIINIDSIVNRDKDDEYFRPIYADLVNCGRDVGLLFRCDICWFKHQVVGRATAWGSWKSPSNPIIRRNHEYLLVWSKDEWGLKGDPKDSDLTQDEFQQWTMSFWQINPETRSKSGHPAPFPEELIHRCIKLFSFKGDIILDPFCGSGTTCYVAHKLSRKYIGIDNDPHWVDYAQKRIASSPDIFK